MGIKRKETFQLLKIKAPPMDSSPIHKASESGDITAISKLISEGISPNEKDQLNWIPLFTAANANQVNAFEKV